MPDLLGDARQGPTVKREKALMRPADARQTSRQRVVRAGYRAVRRAADRFGVQLVRKRFTSPIPVVDELPPDLWEQRSELAGLRFDVEVQLRFIEEHLARYASEFDPPVERPREPDRYFLRNDFYTPPDAQILYAQLRAFRPRQVIELGSGFSSMVIAEAASRNAAAGTPLSHVVVDPYPSAALSHEFMRSRDVVVEKVERLDLSMFESLDDRDVLVVDTSHAVRLGGDVIFVVLDVLPRLKAGVVVHFHDVFLPWHYPRAWYEREEWYWAEQYLLQAFLAFNDQFEVLLGAQLVARERRERLEELLPLATHATSIGQFQSLWLRRRGGSQP
jgi:hypothetical protein